MYGKMREKYLLFAEEMWDKVIVRGLKNRVTLDSAKAIRKVWKPCSEVPIHANGLVVDAESLYEAIFQELGHCFGTMQCAEVGTCIFLCTCFWPFLAEPKICQITEYETTKKVPMYFESQKIISLSGRQQRAYLLLAIFIAEKFSDTSKYEIFMVDCDDFTRYVPYFPICILVHTH